MRRVRGLAKRGRRLVPVAAVVVAAVLGAGCGADQTAVGAAGGDEVIGPPSIKGTVVSGQAAGVEGFMRGVARDVDSFWQAAFRSAKRPYPRAKLFIVKPGQSVQPSCLDQPYTGTTANAFWCAAALTPGPTAKPGVYLNTGWLGKTVYNRYGDFALAYVIAHEYGHHVQWLLGLFTRKARGELLQLHLEMMADCLAGIWARSAFSRGLLSDGDVEEVIRLADLFGDTPGVQRNDPAAHGRAGIRTAWFMNGYQGDGSVADCRTY
jgi:predicted metalloprotease